MVQTPKIKPVGVNFLDSKIILEEKKLKTLATIALLPSHSDALKNRNRTSY